jgi:hypothetical protein
MSATTISITVSNHDLALENAKPLESNNFYDSLSNFNNSAKESSAVKGSIGFNTMNIINNHSNARNRKRKLSLSVLTFNHHHSHSDQPNQQSFQLGSIHEDKRNRRLSLDMFALKKAKSPLLPSPTFHNGSLVASSSMSTPPITPSSLSSSSSSSSSSLSYSTSTKSPLIRRLSQSFMSKSTDRYLNVSTTPDQPQGSPMEISPVSQNLIYPFESMDIIETQQRQHQPIPSPQPSRRRSSSFNLQTIFRRKSVSTLVVPESPVSSPSESAPPAPKKQKTTGKWKLKKVKGLSLSLKDLPKAHASAGMEELLSAKCVPGKKSILSTVVEENAAMSECGASSYAGAGSGSMFQRANSWPLRPRFEGGIILPRKVRNLHGLF